MVTSATILSHARSLFGARDYASVSLEEVAAAARVTRGAVYHHFGSREGLFAAVHGELQALVGAAVEAATDGIEDAEQSLRAGSRAFLATIVDPQCRQVVLVDAPAVLGWDRWRAADAENSAPMLLEVLQELHAAGRLRSGDPEATSALLSGAMNELALWVAHQTDPDLALKRAQAALTTAIDGEVA